MLSRIDKGNLETKTVREVFDSLAEERIERERLSS